MRVDHVSCDGEERIKIMVTLLRMKVELCVATDLGPPWACPWGNESRQLNQFTSTQMETPTGLPHDTRMPVNKSSGCRRRSEGTDAHSRVCEGSVLLADKTCAPTSKLVGGVLWRRYFIWPNGYRL